MQAQYWTYDEMWDALKSWGACYPQLMDVAVIGQSRQGRNMAGVTLTARATGAPETKSAIFVDANIHAGEVTGNAVAMHWMHWCLSQYGEDPMATELLDRHTVYVVPRISLDGAELYLTTPGRVRSSPHIYPYTTPPDGWVPEDVNGDGHILTIRVVAEDGAYAVDEEDPRLMRPRKPAEFGGTYYHLLPEGRVVKTSQENMWPPLAHADVSRRQAMDFNRNFPVRWDLDADQRGAGPFPMSEPEIRSLVGFIHDHSNIAAYVALHTSGGVILRQPSNGEDTTLTVEDRHLFSRIAEMGEEVSGYFARSNHQAFQSGHDNILMPGAADDWMYDHFGVLGFTVEIWDLARHAGARGYAEYGVRHLVGLTPEEDLQDDRKIYGWVSREVPDGALFDWVPWTHPDLGDVEVGGLDDKFVRQNPPEKFLAGECAKVSAFLTRLGLSTPRMVIPRVDVERVGDGIYRVVAEVSNAGFLPTSSTGKGRQLQLEGIKAEITGPIRLVSGVSPHDLGALDGYGHGTARSQRGYTEWVVAVERPCQIVVRFHGQRAGEASRQIQLGGE